MPIPPDTMNTPLNTQEETLFTTHLLSPLGMIFCAASTRGICQLEFMDSQRREPSFQWLQKRLGARVVAAQNPHLNQLAIELNEYFTGTRQHFDVALEMLGTPFDEAVWCLLQRIPYGETQSYTKTAHQLGRPQAVRALARANGRNLISILIPCHRVIGHDGTLRGYRGGLAYKAGLIAHEKKHKP